MPSSDKKDEVKGFGSEYKFWGTLISKIRRQSKLKRAIQNAED